MNLKIALAVTFSLLVPMRGWAAPPIPRAFVGEWSKDPAKCGESGDESYLRIEAHRFQFWESSGPVRAAVTRGRELAVILELSGEGETWLDARNFVVSAHGSRLVSTTGGERFERFRCSSGARPNNSSKPTPLRGAA